MIINYIKIAFRNIMKYKGFSTINILGLAIGLAGFILITLYINKQFAYETSHQKADRIYRPVEIQRLPGIDEQHVAVTMGPLAEALKADIPEIEEAGRLMPVGEIFCEYGDKRYWENSASFADPEIFDIFTLPLIQGNPDEALSQPGSVVIDEELAEKYFGSENPLGKTLIINHRVGKDPVIVKGVMKKYPENSHLNLTMLVSFSLVEGRFDWLDSWRSNSLATYVLLKEGVTARAAEAKFPAFIKKYIPEESSLRNMDIYLQPLKDIHLHSQHIVYQTYRNNLGSYNNVVTFGIISIFILLIAGINFMNLATARSARRAREVGLRKVMGSPRKALIYQFLGESVFIAFIALILALLIIEMVFPAFNHLLDQPVQRAYLSDWKMMLFIVGITFLVGITAGSYPAFFLSSFRPVQTLKGSFTSHGSGALMRRILVVFQFAIAIVLIINTAILMNQMNFINNKDLGYNQEQLVALPVRTDETRRKIELLKNELVKDTRIISAAAASNRNGASGSQGTVTVAGSNDEQKSMMRHSYVDFDFLNTMEMEIVRGRFFSRQHATDSSDAVIINEAAVREFGWGQPLGKQFEWGDDHLATVIGVVRDFHFYSLHYKIEPLIMSIQPDRYNFVLVKVAAENMDQALQHIEQVWNQVISNRPFEYDFVDDYFAARYESTRKTGQLFGSFSFLAIFIACLGLLGLASFSTEQKTKEIGIRKTLGASVSSIVFLLSKEFSRWVIIASLLAFPIAYWTANEWLQQFAYRTEINFVLFILAALGVVFVAWFTIGYQSIRAAVANPIKALRYE